MGLSHLGENPQVTGSDGILGTHGQITSARRQHLLRNTCCQFAKGLSTSADISAMAEQRELQVERVDDQRGHTSKGRRVRRFAAAMVGVLLTASVAYGASNWVIGLSGGSSGEGQSATIANVTITAVAAPAATNLLYPGGTGDVVLTITNPNAYPVTITAVQLPTNVTYATGYTTSGLGVTQGGCLAATPSDVIWNFSTGSSGSSHTLTTALTVAATGQANNPLTVTLTNDASMLAAAPLACANTYFSMPSLTGITATGGAAVVTTSPATDAWTS
jgi:hypothetical protein